MPAPAVEAYLLADLVEVAVAAGERETAVRAARRAEDIAGEIDAPSYQALHLLSSAWVLLAGGRHEAAAAAAAAAVDGLGRSGLLLLQARARVAYATAVRSADRREAADALREAAITFDAAGASLRLERVRRLLAQLGSNGRRAADRLGGPALTEREGEIAKLAARGFTARQIGDGLHIGVRTVETHLARIYPKLGVASKQQLISRGPELGLVPTGRDGVDYRPETVRPAEGGHGPRPARSGWT
jgi:ATP/maltotriose-dependent transcriptional regulator MalT